MIELYIYNCDICDYVYNEFGNHGEMGIKGINDKIVASSE